MRPYALPAVRLLCWLLPAWPGTLYVLTGSRRRLAVLLVVWLALALTRVMAWRRSAYHPLSIYVSHLALCCVPGVLSSVWLLAGPVNSAGSITLVAWSILLLPACDTLWSAFGELTSRWNWSDAVVLPTIALVVALVAFEVVAGPILYRDPFGGTVSTNSTDRSYWYVVRKVDASGAELASTYGFVGPEPMPTYTGLRVLIIGDSIPAAGLPVNFPKVAAALFTQEGAGRVEIVNAAVSGYSLEQMKRFYIERLASLRHDVLVVSFYVDDIDRELRYRKRNYFYTPSWPEWMQDVYYRCFVCRSLLTASGVTENTFLLYRTRGRLESVPAALQALDAIYAQATKRGVAVAILNIPMFNWPDVLATASTYRFSDINAIIETWARDRNVHYHDLLPALVGRDIRPLRRSDTDIHFSDEGHRLVGPELKRLLDDVIARERLHDRLGSPGPHPSKRGPSSRRLHHPRAGLG
jgi:lysophospholipase L1-like esterase